MSSSEASDGRSVATAFITGGGGFTFEDRVGAWLAAGMAAGEMPLGVGVAVPVEVRFQGGASGFFLDDMVVTGDAARRPRWSASVKSFDMLTGARLHTEFVQAAWRDILADRFRPAADRVGLVSGSAAQGTWVELGELIGEAAADQAGIASRIGVPGAFNEAKRSLWESAKCPTELAEQRGVNVDSSPARLLALLLPLRLDFLTPTSQAISDAIRWCRAALVPQQAGRVVDLWTALLEVVADLRPRGGAVTWQLLAERLGGQFAFQLRPDVAPDWSLLATHTASMTARVRDRLGDDVVLAREDVTAVLANAGAVSVLSGPSGCGKTVAAKRWLAAPGTHQAVWLSAADLEAGVGARLRLTRGLEEVLTLASGEVRLVVDGLDRVYTDEPFAVTAALARLAAATGGRIRLLITSQQAEFPRVSEHLVQANGPRAAPLVMGDLSDADVNLVLRGHPDLAAVVVAGGLRGVLRRPKVLDLVLRMPGATVAAIRDEPSIAGLWWQRLAGAGPNGATCQTLLRRIAVEQADRLRAHSPLDDLPVDAVGLVDQLRVDGILSEVDGRVSFTHDLFDDWTLLHYLRSRDDVIGVIAEKAALPSWHRAIRLYAAGVLREHGVDRWEADRTALDAADQPLVADLYLDAVFYAHDADRLLGELWSRLAADSALLARLLRRFRFSATVPDFGWITVLADTPDVAVYAAAQSRLPVWPLWLPVLRVLAAEHETAVATAATGVAAIADLWLRHAPDTWPARDQAAVIGLAVGRHIVAHIDGGGFFDDTVEAVLWRCVIAAGAVEPDAVATFLDALLPPVDSQLEHRGQVRGRQRRGQTGLRAALLDVDTVMPLLPASAQLARDLVLRAAVNSDYHHRHYSHHRLRDGLGIASAPRSFDPIPESGPFRAMLINAEPQGVDLVLALVERATTHWTRTRNAPMPGGQEPAQERPAFELLIDGAPVALVGDATVLAWSNGGHRVPDILAAAMMALEAHLYQALDDGRDITTLLSQLTGSRSVATWGLLADIARHTPALLEGPLAPLVTSADLLDHDRMSVQMHSFSLLPLVMNPTRAMRARKWQTMDHRKTPLLHLVHLGAFVTRRLTEQLTAAREHWAATDAHRWREMLAATDIANYHAVRATDGKPYLVYTPPAALEEEAREIRNHLDRDRAWMMFAHTMRRNITDHVRPSDTELEEQWAIVQPQLDALAPDAESPSSISSVEDLRCGYAAWLVLCARDWLRNHPERETWCKTVLLRPLTDPAATWCHAYPDSPSDDEWDVFCAEGLTALWAETPDDVTVRAAIARLLLVARRLTLTTVMRTAAAHPHLADDLRRLEHLTLHRARLSMWDHDIDPYFEEADDLDFDTDPEEADGLDVDQEDDEPGHGPIDDLPELGAAAEAAFDAFANGSLPAEVPRLADWIATTLATRFPDARDDRSRILRTLDLGYLVASRPHFATLAAAADTRTRARAVEFAADLATFLASGLTPTPAANRSPRYPNDEERRALELLADVTISANAAQARTIWEPILTLGATASSWVDNYLSQVWKTACAKDPWPAAFPTLVADMLDFATTASTWQGRSGTGVLALAVAGLGKWGHSPVSEQQTAAIRAAVPAWSTWFGEHMGHDDFAYAAVRFFQEPAAAAFVHDAVGWLADHERSSDPTSKRLDTAVTEFLVTISTRTPNPLRGSGPTPDNGRQLLARLHGRGNAVAGQLLNSLT
ncbi:hypothetical protein [Micromonospora sp. RTGN7]|uniref:hypothetical protein n=1 Tax=Micromonospora sp. RTGN7 TaxID=3016526 RepID=UPI0029FEE144|nr:hypothetical protein [Micromonospora sp. RTGN7]